MSAAWFVGRVGGLAVALGVGAAATLGAPAAWADDAGTEGSDGSASTSTTAGGGTSESQDPSTGTTEPSGSGSATTTKTSTTGSTRSLLRQAMPGIVRSSGGAHSSIQTTDLRATLDNVVEAFTTGQRPTSGSRATVRGGTNRQQRTVDAPKTSTVTRFSPPSRPDVPSPRHIVADYTRPRAVLKSTVAVPNPTFTTARLRSFSTGVAEPTEPRPTLTTVVLAALSASGLGPLTSNGPATPVDSPLGLALLAIGARTRQPGSSQNLQSMSNAQTFTALAINTTPVITSLSAGNPNVSTGKVSVKVVASDADRNPLTYTATTTGKGTTTFNAFTKTFTYTPTAAARHAASSATATATDKQDIVTVTVTDGQGGVTSRSVTVAISPANRAPTASVSVGTPDTTGMVTGTVTGTDQDNDALKYAAPTTTSKGGAVTINPTTGVFTYKPTPAARQAAAAPGASSAAKTDKFNVTITDGHGGTFTKAVTVSIAPAVTAGNIATELRNFTLSGYRSGSAVLSPDGSRSVVTTYVPSAIGVTTRVSVVNTATGAQVGTTVALTGTPSGIPAQFSTDGSRAVVITYVSTSEGTTTRISLINTATGAQVGTTSTLTGSPADVRLLNADGSRALITTTITDATGTTTTQAALIDTATGAQTGRTISIDGLWSHAILLNSNGSRALVTTVEQTDHFVTRIAVIDTATGLPAGTTLEFIGYGVPQLSSDGTRALIATTAYDPVSGKDIARVALIDTKTGDQISAPPGFIGANLHARPLNSDGSRALITYLDQSPGMTRTSVIDTTSGAQIGAGLSLAGSESFASQAFSSDGTHALITTIERSETTGAYTTRAAVINTATGDQVGVPITIAGEVYNAQLLRADGSRALISTATYDGRTSTFITRAAVIDTTTGAQIGSPVTLTGYSASGPVQLSRDGTRAVIATTNGSATQVAVINTVNGVQVGNTISLTGPGYTLMSADGSRAVVATSYGTKTQVAVIDTATGIFKTFTYSSAMAGTPILTPDGKRVLITLGANPVRVVVLKIA